MELQHAADPGQPGVSELLDTIVARTLPSRTDALTRRIAYRVIVAMAQTAARKDTAPEIAALLGDRVHEIATNLSKRRGDPWAAQLSRQLLDPETLEKLLADRPRTMDVPPGDPIGGAESEWMGDLGF